MDEQKTYICECGMTLVTGIGHKKNDQCCEEYKVEYRCGFCGSAEIRYAFPRIEQGFGFKFLFNKIICIDCQSLAFEYLSEKFKDLS